MPTIFLDQLWLVDPFSPRPAGTTFRVFLADGVCKKVPSIDGIQASVANGGVW